MPLLIRGLAGGRDRPGLADRLVHLHDLLPGQGAASKEQVASMLMRILKFDSIELKLDATDGLAAALCHFYQTNNPTKEKSYNSWKDYMNKNPKRIKKV